MSDQLPTYIQIDAVIKKCNEEGMFFYIPQRGDRQSGTVLLKLTDTKGQCKLLTQMRDVTGALKWSPVLGEGLIDEKEADGYIAHAKDMDPDQWIIEIEDPAFQNPFEF